MSGGRPRDPIWDFFKERRELGENKAECSCGDMLTPTEMKAAQNLILSDYPHLFSDFIEYLGSRKDDYKESFSKVTCKVEDFVKAQMITGQITKGIGDLALMLFDLPPSSAGIERAFSSLGYVHSDIRNRLGQEKATKLAFIMRMLHSEGKDD